MTSSILLALTGCGEIVAQIDPPGPTAPVPPTQEATEAAPPALVFNEIQTDNDATVMDAALDYPDWVEIYNASDQAIALSRVVIDDGATSWTGGAGEIAPGARLLIWADGSGDPERLPFALSSDGERLTLSVDGAPVDRFATGELAGDTAWARFPDGGAWSLTARPTPGEANGSAPTESADPSDQLFQSERVERISLTLSDAALDSLAADPYGEVEAALGWRRAWFPRVGIRIKGVYGSLRSLDQKTAFKVDLNAFEDRRLMGQESLTINNMVQDPTYIAEHLAYQTFRAAGVPAPRTGWTELYVNGEYWGLYALVETVDDTFLGRWYADPTGHLYEGAYGVDFEAGEIASFEHDEGAEPDDRAALYAVAAVLDGPADDAGIAALEALVDLDEFLANMAAEALLLHWDGYTTSNNYRVYLDPVTGRLQIIPWGTDQTFVDAWYGPWDAGGRVFVFCLENADCAARYDEILLETSLAMDDLALGVQAGDLLAWLEPWIAAEPRGEHSMDTHRSYAQTMMDTIWGWPDEVREQIAER